MFKSASSQKAAEILYSQIEAAKSELKAIQGQCGEDMLQIMDVVSGKEDLEKEVIQLANETSVLKKSAPEGTVEESNIQYFLAISELEKTNQLLRHHEAIAQENLKSFNEDISAIKKLIEDVDQTTEMLTTMKSQLGDSENNPNRANVLSKNVESDIENKTRATRKIYQELKTFLSTFLDRIDPSEKSGGGQLGSLLQELWSTFQSKGPEEAFVKMSHLVDNIRF